MSGPPKGPLGRAMERLHKKAGNKKGSVNVQPTISGTNWSRPVSGGPPPLPSTPTSPEPIYSCPIIMQSGKPLVGPKPGDLEVLQKFFGLRTPLDLEGAQRLAWSTNEDGGTPLHQAARESGATEVSALIRIGAPIDVRDNFGFQPVHKAAAAGSVQVLQLLKLAGADLQAQGNHGYMPIHRAAMNGGMEAVRWLVEQGCAVDATIPGGWTPLHLAVWWDREHVVRCLLGLGAQVNYMTDQGMTPLSLAVWEKHYDLELILVNQGGVIFN